MTCRHNDVQVFGDVRCCLSCGEAIFWIDPVPRISSVAPAPAPSSESYQYRPLRHELGQEIRLLTLYPCADHQELRCDITHVNLAERPVYEAISYKWADASGDSSLSQILRCGSGGQIIYITKNCEAALRRLKHDYRRRTLWIDSVCIHHSNNLERTHQVQLMSAIYTQASLVVAYLGIGQFGMSTGLQKVIDILQEESAVPPLTRNIIHGVQELLSLRYFQRVWVLQEIGLAQLVAFVVGTRTVRWTASSIRKLLQLCLMVECPIPPTLYWTPARRPGEEDDLLSVVYKSRNCDATDPRDKIFALLGLVHPKFSVEFPVDYSLTTMETFTKFATYCMSLGRYDALQHTSGKPQDADKVPTWVPQWDERLDYQPLPAQFSESDKEAFVSSWYVADSTWLQEDPIRRTWMAEVIAFADKAIMADELSDLSRFHLSTLSWRRYAEKWMMGRSKSHPVLSADDLKHLVQHLVYRQNRGFRYEVSEHLVDRWRSGHFVTKPMPYLKIRAQRLDRIFRVLDTYTVEEEIKLPWEPLPAIAGSDLVCSACARFNIDESTLRPLPDEDIPMTHERREFARMAKRNGFGQTVFEGTQTLGFTRTACAVNGVIWALEGGDVPFILRQVEDHYIMIGECYLHKVGLPHRCRRCGNDATPWPMQTEILDIW